MERNRRRVRFRRRTLFAIATVAILGIATVRGQVPGGEDRINIQAYIDGRSRLILRDNTARWHHLDFAAPGRWLFQNLPTVINGTNWFPTWPDVPDAENRCGGCFSNTFTGLQPPIPERPVRVRLEPVRSRHQTTLVEAPTQDNDFGVVIEFDDNPVGGADWYEVNVFLQRILIVDLDIKPGSFPNTINVASKGEIPVAVLGSDQFDVRTANVNTVRFGPRTARPTRVALEDVNSDGKQDLVFHFQTGETGLTCGFTEAKLTGSTLAGTLIEGKDSVRIVPCD